MYVDYEGTERSLSVLCLSAKAFHLPKSNNCSFNPVKSFTKRNVQLADRRPATGWQCSATCKVSGHLHMDTHVFKQHTLDMLLSQHRAVSV